MKRVVTTNPKVWILTANAVTTNVFCKIYPDAWTNHLFSKIHGQTATDSNRTSEYLQPSVQESIQLGRQNEVYWACSHFWLL